MANVSFHRTSKRQEIIKAELVKNGYRTADEMNAYKGVKLGDDDTVILTRPATDEELATVRESVVGATSATVSEVFASFGGRVKLVDRYAEISVKVSL